MRYRILGLGFLGLALGLLASGCGRGSGKPKFAFLSNNVHGFWTYAQRGCEKAAKELDVEVEFRRPDPGPSPNSKRSSRT
jgi:ABC-type sugar transport system substrate-binding protein